MQAPTCVQEPSDHLHALTTMTAQLSLSMLSRAILDSFGNLPSSPPESLLMRVINLFIYV